jgi:hypothetical protein
LLQELVARVESILDENFVGAYLVGSFARVVDVQEDLLVVAVT